MRDTFVETVRIIRQDTNGDWRISFKGKTHAGLFGSYFAAVDFAYGLDSDSVMPCQVWKDRRQTVFA